MDSHNGSSQFYPSLSGLEGTGNIEMAKQSIPSSSVIKERTLIIGNGEIGKSLKNVLSEHYSVTIRDKENIVDPHHYRVMHIAYPYSDSFIENTKNYIEIYNPELTVIHSTVKPGTVEKLGKGVVHSPVNGRHPNLEDGIKKFVKIVAGNDIFSVYEAVRFFNEAGISTRVFANAKTSELAKVLCTSYYGWNLVFMKEVARVCELMGVPFQEVYTEWNTMYNEGYANMGEVRFLRPVLFPMSGEIGGHCVIPNCDLLDDFITHTIKERNQMYKRVEKIKKKEKRNVKKISHLDATA